VPARVSDIAHQSLGAAYAAAGQVSAAGHSALGQAIHTAATNAFIHGLSVSALVAGGVAAAGAILAAWFLPAQPAGSSVATPAQSRPALSAAGSTVTPDTDTTHVR
jgi:hypothetical protein